MANVSHTVYCAASGFGLCPAACLSATIVFQLDANGLAVQRHEKNIFSGLTPGVSKHHLLIYA
eukprot:6192708-Pleurochrysis_carterae.AAC.3